MLKRHGDIRYPNLLKMCSINANIYLVYLYVAFIELAITNIHLLQYSFLHYRFVCFLQAHKRIHFIFYVQVNCFRPTGSLQIVSNTTTSRSPRLSFVIGHRIMLIQKHLPGNIQKAYSIIVLTLTFAFRLFVQEIDDSTFAIIYNF